MDLKLFRARFKFSVVKEGQIKSCLFFAPSEMVAHQYIIYWLQHHPQYLGGLSKVDMHLQEIPIPDDFVFDIQSESHLIKLGQ